MTLRVKSLRRRRRRAFALEIQHRGSKSAWKVSAKERRRSRVTGHLPVVHTWEPAYRWHLFERINHTYVGGVTRARLCLASLLQAESEVEGERWFWMEQPQAWRHPPVSSVGELRELVPLRTLNVINKHRVSMWGAPTPLNFPQYKKGRWNRYFLESFPPYFVILFIFKSLFTLYAFQH